MIKNKNLTAHINTRNLKYYKKLGYSVNLRDVIEVPVDQYHTKRGNFLIDAECDICGNIKSLQWENYCINVSNMNIYCCSEKCARIKVENTTFQKYGVLNVFQSDEIKIKLKNTTLIKHGDENFRNPLKTKLTNINRHNNENYTNSEKRNKTIFEKYKVRNIFQLTKNVAKCLKAKQVNNKLYMYKKYEYLNIINYDGQYFEFPCDLKNDHNFKIHKKLLRSLINNKTSLCTVCNGENMNISGKEIELYNYIMSIYDGQIDRNDRKTIKGYEIDLYLPDIKLGIEFNGMLWHSDYYKNNNYHYNKYNTLYENNIKYINIWENEWDENKDFIKNKIKQALNSLINKTFDEINIIEKEIIIERNWLNELPYINAGYKIVDILPPKIIFSQIKYNNFNVYNTGYFKFVK